MDRRAGGGWWRPPMDPLSPAKRSERMGRIRAKNTKPEMAVRRLVHAMGYRYRLHSPKLPGKPDLVFPARRKVVLVHGCFWHRHGCKAGSRTPVANAAYWIPKLAKNRRRDAVSRARLSQAGWQVLVVWECQVRDARGLENRLRRFLG